jgi:hypothetical protein
MIGCGLIMLLIVVSLVASCRQTAKKDDQVEDEVSDNSAIPKPRRNVTKKD